MELDGLKPMAPPHPSESRLRLRPARHTSAFGGRVSAAEPGTLRGILFYATHELRGVTTLVRSHGL